MSNVEEIIRQTFPREWRSGDETSLARRVSKDPTEPTLFGVTDELIYRAEAPRVFEGIARLLPLWKRLVLLDEDVSWFFTFYELLGTWRDRLPDSPHYREIVNDLAEGTLHCIEMDRHLGKAGTWRRHLMPVGVLSPVIVDITSQWLSRPGAHLAYLKLVGLFLPPDSALPFRAVVRHSGRDLDGPYGGRWPEDNKEALLHFLSPPFLTEALTRLRVQTPDMIPLVDPLEECLNAHRESYESDVLTTIESL